MTEPRDLQVLGHADLAWNRPLTEDWESDQASRGEQDQGQAQARAPQRSQIIAYHHSAHKFIALLGNETVLIENPD
jgi:hypothetical protein